MTLLAEAQVEAMLAETKTGNLQVIVQGSNNNSPLAHGIQHGSGTALGLASQARKRCVSMNGVLKSRLSLVALLALMLACALAV